MVKIEEFIKANAPGSLYGEWAKKEECWSLVREQDFSLSLHSLSEDLTNSSGNRKRLTKEETEQAEINAIVERLKSVHPKTGIKLKIGVGKQENYLLISGILLMQLANEPDRTSN